MFDWLKKIGASSEPHAGAKWESTASSPSKEWRVEWRDASGSVDPQFRGQARLVRGGRVARVIAEAERPQNAAVTDHGLVILLDWQIDRDDRPKYNGAVIVSDAEKTVVHEFRANPDKWTMQRTKDRVRISFCDTPGLGEVEPVVFQLSTGELLTPAANALVTGTPKPAEGT